MEQEIFNNLIQDKIVFEESEQSISCKNPECDYNDDTTLDLQECPSCGNTELKICKYDSLKISLDTVRTFVKELISTFCNETGWELSKDTEKNL